MGRFVGPEASHCDSLEPAPDGLWMHQALTLWQDRPVILRSISNLDEPAKTLDSLSMSFF